MEPIRVAQIIGNSACGGVINCLMNYYRNIDRTKVQFDFFTYGPSPYDEEIWKLGGKVIFFPQVFSFAKAIKTLKEKLKGYKVVHVHMTTLSFVGLCAAQLAGVPVRICHSHSATDHKDGWKLFVKEVLRYPTRMFAKERMGCCRMSNEWLYGKNTSAVIVHNAIDLKRFTPTSARDSLRQKYGLGDKFVYGFIGRFETQKNVPFLIKSFALVVKEKPESRLVLVGDGTQKSKILALIRENDLSDKVIILPDSPWVEKYYMLFDLFVLPSIFEGLPLVAVEAQAMSLPCLLSDHITEDVMVGGNCRLASIDKPEVWANAMLEAAADMKGVECHEALTENGYDIRLEAPKLQELYLSYL